MSGETWLGRVGGRGGLREVRTCLNVGREGNRRSEMEKVLSSGWSEIPEGSGGHRSWSTDGGLVLAFKLDGAQGKWVFVSC